MKVLIPVIDKHQPSVFVVSTSPYVGYVNLNGVKVPVVELLEAISHVSLPDDFNSIQDTIKKLVA